MSKIDWKPSCWMKQNALQIPDYDKNFLNEVKETLYSFSPLIAIDEIIRLKEVLMLVYENKGFILHAGDCAEPFADSEPNIINSKLLYLGQLAKELEGFLNKKVYCIGRQAGQFAKPRTQNYETINNIEMLTYRGDIINSSLSTKEARQPDPGRMIEAYFNIHKILNCYQKNLNERAPMYFSHESLLLHFDECMTRQDSTGAWFNTSTHLLWLGIRTVIDSFAHREYVAGIENPIALKVGPDTSLPMLMEVINYINKEKPAEALLIIYRFGIAHLEKCLPKLLNILKTSSQQLLLLCDPMHGNTKTYGNQKARHPLDIINELLFSVSLHKEMQVPLHGIHIETTYEKVDECVEVGQFSQIYRSLVDPRLNRSQCQQLFKQFAIEEAKSNCLPLSMEYL